MKSAILMIKHNAVLTVGLFLVESPLLTFKGPAKPFMKKTATFRVFSMCVKSGIISN